MVVAAAPLANPKHKINTCTRSDKISFFFLRIKMIITLIQNQKL